MRVGSQTNRLTASDESGQNSSSGCSPEFGYSAHLSSALTGFMKNHLLAVFRPFVLSLPSGWRRVRLSLSPRPRSKHHKKKSFVAQVCRAPADGGESVSRESRRDDGEAKTAQERSGSRRGTSPLIRIRPPTTKSMARI